MRWPVWLGLTVFLGLLCGRLVSAAEGAWKVGTARIVITPQEPLWMAGFASRNHPAEGKLHDLWVKILVLEAADGHRGLIVTSDVCGISKATYETLCGELEKRCGLARPQIKFTYSHTHSGPALRECLEDYYSWDDAARNRVTQYTLELEKAVADGVAEALAGMKPAALWATEGTADFGVNRRNNKESQIDKLLAGGQPLEGPVDHRVPLLAVRGSDAEGNSVEATLQTLEGYRLTVLTALASLEKVLAVEVPYGFSTPSKAFGPEFVLNMPETDFRWETE
ncbi:MAG: hypothetical protein ACYTG0_19745 [Planctomycetota bacterium]|jgi:hypothetical protein